MNGIGPIKEETKRKVLEAAEALGYFPNAIAKSFVTQRSGNIGVSLPSVPNVRLFSTYYFSEILSGIGFEVQKHGYGLLLQFREWEGKPDFALPFHTRKIDASLILGVRMGGAEEEAAAELEREGMPFCLIGSRGSSPSFSAVDADHCEGTGKAVRHLVEQGFRRLAFVNGPLVYSNSVDRQQGFEAEIKRQGLDVADVLYLEGNYSRSSGLELAAQLYAQRDRFDAIVAGNDRMGIGIVQGLKERGMLAGNDYGIVGCDDSDASKILEPPLTTVRVPFFEMGRAAASRILEGLKSGEARLEPFHETLPTELIIRESSLKAR